MMKSEYQAIAEDLAVIAVRLQVLGEEAHASTLSYSIRDLVDKARVGLEAEPEEEETEGL